MSQRPQRHTHRRMPQAHAQPHRETPAYTRTHLCAPTPRTMKQSVDQPITNPAAHASGSTNVSGARVTKSGGASGNASRLKCGHDVVRDPTEHQNKELCHLQFEGAEQLRACSCSVYELAVSVAVGHRWHTRDGSQALHFWPGPRYAQRGQDAAHAFLETRDSVVVVSDQPGLRSLRLSTLGGKDAHRVLRARRVGRVLPHHENQKSEQWCRSTAAGWHS